MGLACTERATALSRLSPSSVDSFALRDRRSAHSAGSLAKLTDMDFGSPGYAPNEMPTDFAVNRFMAKRGLMEERTAWDRWQPVGGSVCDTIGCVDEGLRSGDP